MKNAFMFCLLLTIAFTAIVSSSMADVPRILNYQGRLTDDAGLPLNGEVDIVFVIYDDSTGGILRYAETHANVPVEDGLFSATIGESNDLPSYMFEGEDRWLQLVVDGDSIKPRTLFTSVPYAYKSGYADTSGYALTGSPLAYGVIDFSGDVQAGTPNFTSTWNAAEQRYEITIDGGGYIYDTHSTVVTPIGGGDFIRIPQTGSIGGKLLVFILDGDGNKVQNKFHFIVFEIEI